MQSSQQSPQRRYFAPEVIQTSAMDCGPASLKCLLQGFSIPVSYGRLREACQTDVDGSSIDTIEEVAVQLGLDAEQIMLPLDHLLIEEAGALPGLIVVRIANGNTHFVIVWRKHGPVLQIMDPASGRRWPLIKQFLDEVYIHQMPVPAGDWEDWARTDEFLIPLRIRLLRVLESAQHVDAAIASMLAQPGWDGIARVDAAVRLTTSLIEAKSVRPGSEAQSLIERLIVQSENDPLIPSHYYTVTPLPPDDDGEEQLLLRGAVILRAKGRISEPDAEASALLSPELVAALAEPSSRPLRTILQLLREDGWLGLGVLGLGVITASAGRVLEALLMRGMLDIGQVLETPFQRIGATAALITLLLVLTTVETSVVSGLLQTGRTLEARLRMLFLKKLPRLSDHYFHSRLTSDMAERSHSIYQIRELPSLGGRTLQTGLEFFFTVVAMIWLYPPGAPLIMLTALAWLLVPVLTRPAVEEADLRLRSITGALSRFYLDSLLGLIPIRTHGAQRAMRQEHQTMVHEWQRALRYYADISILFSMGMQYLAGYPLIAAVVLMYALQGGQPGALLLYLYWAMNLQSAGESFMWSIQRYPTYRNLAARLLEPITAPEEATTGKAAPAATNAASISMQGVAVAAAGHTILESIDLEISGGEHIGIVGPSGAGKSSLVGLLLGWHRAREGTLLVDGNPLTQEHLITLRQHIAWVDPAIQLWNRSIRANLLYGAGAISDDEINPILQQAELIELLSRLQRTYGLESPLGEGGGLISGGEGQRVRLGRAMLRTRSRLVILDEPFRGLDQDRRKELLRRARDLWRDVTLLCITHDVSDTLGFDRALVVENGSIVEDGPPRDLSTDPGSRYYALLQSEQEVRSQFWEHPMWRRLHMTQGELTEEVRASQ